MIEFDLDKILVENTSNSLFGDVVRGIINFLNSATGRQAHGPSGNGQMSKELSELHAFRKRSGYYKEGVLLGLDETIESLGCCDMLVRTAVFEFDQGLVALWLDDQRMLRGLFLARKQFHPDYDATATR